MSRPIPQLAPPPSERRWSPPAWDPNAIAADYLLALGERAGAGPLDPAWVDMLMSHLVMELRTAYSPEKVEAAVVNLRPLLERWEQYAAERHLALSQPQEPEAEPTQGRRVVVPRVFARAVGVTGSAAKRTAKVLTGWRSARSAKRQQQA